LLGGSSPLGPQTRDQRRRHPHRRTAAPQYLIAYTIDDDQPPRELRLGFDTRGRLLEIVVLLLDDGTELAIHAMNARPQYLDLLP
jgi:hypothetical protein